MSDLHKKFWMFITTSYLCFYHCVFPYVPVIVFSQNFSTNPKSTTILCITENDHFDKTAGGEKDANKAWIIILRLIFVS